METPDRASFHDDSQLTFSPIKGKGVGTIKSPKPHHLTVKPSEASSLRLDPSELQPSRDTPEKTFPQETSKYGKENTRHVSFTPPNLKEDHSGNKYDASLEQSPQVAGLHSTSLSPNSPNLTKKGWLASKRAEYSSKLISPNRLQSFDEHQKSPFADILTSSSLHLTWEARQVVQLYLGVLEKVYTSYASYGEVELSMNLGSSNFHRLINDCMKYVEVDPITDSSLVRQNNRNYLDYVNTSRFQHFQGPDTSRLDPREVEIMFLEYSKVEHKERHPRNSTLSSSMFPVDNDTLTERISEAKISFEDFINIIQRVAIMVYPSRLDHDALREFLKKQFSPLLESDIVQTGLHDLNCVSRLKEILQNPVQLKILGTLYKNIQVYFTFYTSCRGKLDFKGFQSFFKDFGIYPSLISMKSLQRYFSALASLEVAFTDRKEQTGLIDNQGDYRKGRQYQLTIGCHQFVEGIALILEDIGPSDTDSFEVKVRSLGYQAPHRTQNTR